MKKFDTLQPAGTKQTLAIMQSKDLQRRTVLSSYHHAIQENEYEYHIKKNSKVTERLFYPNQIMDAENIVNMFYADRNLRVISVSKLTKIGADGLMILVAKLMTAHEDDNFITDLSKVRIITGMSNAAWEADMKERAPSIFRDKIFHHGQLNRADLMNLRDGLVIIDEIDTGDKEFQRMHALLEESRLLDVRFAQENNIRMVVISATLLREQEDLARWGDLHQGYRMTVPDNYIGHKEFLEQGIIQEFYPLDTQQAAEQWIREDILDRYGDDFRVHMVRVMEGKKRNTLQHVQNACQALGIEFRNHTSEDRISDTEYQELFVDPLPGHIVLGVKGFYRRANLIPNNHKLRIGAMHERHTVRVDNNVQVQGLPGRMTGHWKDKILAGHLTGPYRTSIQAIREYIQSCGDYQCAGFIRKDGTVRMYGKKTFMNPVHVSHLPEDATDGSLFRREFREFDTLEDMNAFIKTLSTRFHHKVFAQENENGFRMCSTSGSLAVHSYEDILRLRDVPPGKECSNMPQQRADLARPGDITHRCYVCYRDMTDRNSACYVVIWVTRTR